LGRYVHILSESENVRIEDVNNPGTTIVARPVGHISQKETHVFEQIPGLPAEIGARWWLCEGQPEFSMNLPFYGNMNDTHPAYKKLTISHAYDPESAFWIFREVSYLARSNRAKYGKPINAYYHAYEKRLFAEQEGITKELIERYNKDRKDAAEWITDYLFATQQAAMNRAGLIRKELVKHMATKSGDLFVVPSDTIPYVNAHFEIHPTSGDALLTNSDIAEIVEIPQDKPSSPSIRLTALASPAIHKIVMGIANTPNL
jgi:dipeptidase